MSTNHNLSFSVGNQKLKAFGSVAYLNNPGIVENSAYERFTARLNVNAELKPWITMGMNISGLKSNAEMGSKYMSSLLVTSPAPVLFTGIRMAGMDLPRIWKRISKCKVLSII